LFFASHGRLGGHGFESRVADWGNGPRGGSSGGLPGGLRSQGGSRANEVDRTVPEVDQCGAVSEHFCTASGSVQFGPVRATLSFLEEDVACGFAASAFSAVAALAAEASSHHAV
jgi:hypothetical protein